jgi:two-component system, cell cycle sensor histidine kinase PleC
MARAPLAIASALRYLPRFGQIDSAALLGHARLFAHPAYARLVAAEPLVRRAIPFLILVAVLMLGVMRVAALSEQRDADERRARETLLLVAKSILGDLAALGDRLSLSAPPEAVAGQLLNVLPPGAADEGRVVLLADPERRIVAGAPARPDDIGRSLDDVLGLGQPLTTLGANAGVLAIRLPSGERVIATVHHGAGGTGSVAVLQPLAAVFADWRSSVSRETAAFVAVSAVLVLLGLAYHAQAARADEADCIYSETQNRLHMALRRGRSGLWDWDLSRGVMFWSQSMFEMLGLPMRAGLMSVGEVADLFHPADGDLVGLANGLLTAEGGQVDREFRLRHADGRWIWFRARSEVVWDLDDHPHLIGIAVDVTDQRRVLEASRTADLRLRDAIEAITEAFVLWDSANRLVLCNSKYQELYDLPDDLVQSGTEYEAIIRGGRRPAVTKRLAVPGDGAEAGARSVEARLEDGRWLQISERRTKDGGFVSVGTDITALKQHESHLLENERALTATVADLRKSRQQLEVQAQQLVELAESYVHEKERAEELSRAKSVFLATMSHELRTPLNAIIGFSEMMLSGTFGPLGHDRYADYCRDIHRSGHFLLGVLSDILDMAHMETGHVELRPERLDLALLIDNALRGFALEAEFAGIRLAADVAPGLDIEADRKALGQIVSHLISNAVKFTPQGGEVRVAAAAEDDAVRLSVADTGVGIPQAALGKLGRPFEQVQDQFTRTHRGSGLGLAITRSLVTFHGGEMRIESREGLGTRVTVVLPRRSPRSALTGAEAEMATA